MARRLIPNLEEKILTETINMGAEVGVSRVSTIQLAQKCGITEPTIYGRFKTKSDLLYAAYLYINVKFESFLREIDWETVSTIDEIKAAWDRMFEYAVFHPAQTKYFDSFRHTTTHNSAEPSMHRNYYAGIAKRLVLYHSAGKELPEIEYLKIWVNWVDLSLRLAELVIDGLLPLNARTKNLLFQLIFDRLAE